ncbi:MAG TPA: hypothetical protein DEV93_18530, partial [Chloroflexi bacterium]|nr:hypothetical protein [Chloroflexota bacterium]
MRLAVTVGNGNSRGAWILTQEVKAERAARTPPIPPRWRRRWPTWGATDLMQQAVAGARALGDTWSVTPGLHILGLLASDRGDLAAAGDLLGQALKSAITLGPRNVGLFIQGCAALALACGHAARAARLFGAGASLGQKAGRARPMADTSSYGSDTRLLDRVRCSAEASDWPRARDGNDAALVIAPTHRVSRVDYGAGVIHGRRTALLLAALLLA